MFYYATISLVAFKNTFTVQTESISGFFSSQHSSVLLVDEVKVEKTLHDFRSYLNIVMGYSEMTLDGVLGDVTEEQRDYINDILTKSQQMLGLINDTVNW
jgi:signal transduction histidine kinase